MKFTPRWNWENSWLGFSSAAYLVFPWAWAALTVPHLKSSISQAEPGALGRTFLFGLGWGLGALLMGLGVDHVGLAVGFAIVLGLAASMGTLIPLLMLTPEKLYGPGGTFIILGMVIMLAGIFLCSWAGKVKESKSIESGQGRKAASGSYGLGLTLCILSGVLSSCGNLGFAFGSAITASAVRHGAAEGSAPNLLWAVITLPLFACNASYCAYLLERRRSFHKFLQWRSASHYLLAALMGALWLGGMVFYGIGANRLGRLGPSIGWSILMSSVVIVANVWGIATGEWRGSGRKPVRLMIAGLALLVAAIFTIGYSNGS
jgi:L-rhamnose-H+ transport protein